ncbi:MAG: hypothetical protein ABEJ65_02265 [bacterium]
MRKSEAELLLERIEQDYEGSLSLGVVNLRSLGFRFPEEEHPYFVVGYESDEEEETHESTLQQQREVVVWDDRTSGWSVRHVQKWEISRSGRSGKELFIYDTRNREFVPPEEFHIPSEPV